MADQITYGSPPLALPKRRDPGVTVPTHVRVRATTEEYRRHLRHGVTKQRFLPDINQTVEWPNNVFTNRRLNEGSIVLATEEAPSPSAASDQSRRRKE